MSELNDSQSRMPSSSLMCRGSTIIRCSHKQLYSISLIDKANMSDNRPILKCSGRRRSLRCLLVFTADMYYTTAFSSRLTGHSLSSRSLRMPRDTISVFTARRSFEYRPSSSDRLSFDADTGHDRQKLQQTLLPIVKEYQRIQSVLNQHGKTSSSSSHCSSTPRLCQAILCGYVAPPSSSSLSASNTQTLDLLVIDEESKGLDKFERILEEGPRARELLITSNMGLVRHVVETVLSSYYHIPQHSTSKHTPRTLTSGTAGKKLLYSLTRQDLIQEGAIGLVRAIDKYDATLASSAAFSTYAFYWIRAAVLRAIAQKDELVRVPEHVTLAITKIVRATHRLGLSNSLDSAQALQQDMLEQYHSLTHTLPIRLYTTKGSGGDSSKWEEAETAKRLADEAGVSLSLLKDALTIQHRRQVNHRLGGALSLEPWMASSSSSSSITTTAEPHSGDAHVHDDPKVDFLKESLSKHVNSKEMEALCLRYGLVQPKQHPGFRDYEAEAEVELFGDSSYPVSSTSIVNKESYKIESRQKLAPLPIGGRWGEAMSFAEIGQQMQVSAEYGRRLCSSALKKLKHAAEEGRLDPALLYL